VRWTRACVGFLRWQKPELRPQGFILRVGMRPAVPRVPAPETDGIVQKTLRQANDTPDEDLSERELVLERLAR